MYSFSFFFFFNPVFHKQKKNARFIIRPLSGLKRKKEKKRINFLNSRRSDNPN